MIAHAPEDLAALVAEVERLRGQIDAVRALLGRTLSGHVRKEVMPNV
jgi:hypothetical protein